MTSSNHSKTPVEAIFLFAMQSEADPLIKRADAKPVGKLIGGDIYQFEINGHSYGLVVNGKSPRHGCDRIGTEAAILSAWSASQMFECDWFISAGSSGAFDPSLEIGDVVVATESACYYDHRIDLDEFADYARGEYPVYTCPVLLSIPDVKNGRVATGHSLDMSPRCKERLESLQASVKEMEAAAIAQLCDEQGWRFSAIKVVSNAAGDHAPGEFEANLQYSIEKLTDVILAWLNKKHG